MLTGSHQPFINLSSCRLRLVIRVLRSTVQFSVCELDDLYLLPSLMEDDLCTQLVDVLPLLQPLSRAAAFSSLFFLGDDWATSAPPPQCHHSPSPSPRPGPVADSTAAGSRVSQKSSDTSWATLLSRSAIRLQCRSSCGRGSCWEHYLWHVHWHRSGICFEMQVINDMCVEWIGFYNVGELSGRFWWTRPLSLGSHGHRETSLALLQPCRHHVYKYWVRP